ncbi:MAG: hypothetical protein PHS10_06590 [Thiovulaceae bacterium]|nr:hypothetical protein [Sulfurimonadaceae bacterium]
MVDMQEATEGDAMKNPQKYTTIKINTKNRKNSSVSQKYFASIKKHFCTTACQENSWHVVKNN